MKSSSQAMTFELEAIKPSKASNVKLTKRHQSVKAADSLGAHVLTWILFKRLVRFLWKNKVAITVNLFLIENGYFVARYFGLI